MVVSEFVQGMMCMAGLLVGTVMIIYIYSCCERIYNRFVRIVCKLEENLWDISSSLNKISSVIKPDENACEVPIIPKNKETDYFSKFSETVKPFTPVLVTLITNIELLVSLILVLILDIKLFTPVLVTLITQYFMSNINRNPSPSVPYGDDPSKSNTTRKIFGEPEVKENTTRAQRKMSLPNIDPQHMENKKKID